MEFNFVFGNDVAKQAACAWVEDDSCNFQLSRKYQIYYRFLRPLMPIAVRQLLQRGRKIETTEHWYRPSRFMQLMAECLDSGNQDFITVHPWPDGSEFAFVLTHDVETAEGMRHIARIADYEESLGLRSCWNLIPYKYPIDMGLVNDLKSRGFEIGIHGYNHDGKLYSSRREFDRRAKGINAAIRKYDAVGFRSPMVHRNLNWLQSLEIEHDGSCFDIDPFQAAPGGVGSIWPFVAGRFVELPYTMPQDHTLFVGLGEQNDRIWKDKLDYIRARQGMVLMLTHPDYLTGHRESNIYFEFLRHVVATGGFWHANPKEVASWWRVREKAIESGRPERKSYPIVETVGYRPTIAKINLIDNSPRFIPA
jgi:peptidoglycan/xylan/chitin deacetylase (PgdA/CDA1 family)